jgi:DNA-directed RNA polymerase specialized sigma subunit
MEVNMNPKERKKAIFELVFEQGKKQRDVAKALGVTPQYVSKIVRQFMDTLIKK